MRLRFNIRTQLLLMFLLLLLAVFAISGTTTFTDQNINVVLEAQSRYLERDAEISDTLNDFILFTNDFIDLRVEQFLSTITINSDAGPTESQINFALNRFQTTYDDLIELIFERQEEGYHIDKDDFSSIPFLLEVDEDILEEIDSIVFISSFGVYPLFSSQNETVTSIVDILGSELNSISSNYRGNATEFHDSFSTTISLKDTIIDSLYNLSDSIITGGNLADIQAVQPVISNFTLQLDDITDNTANIMNEWNDLVDADTSAIGLHEDIGLVDYLSQNAKIALNINDLLGQLDNFNDTIFTGTENTYFANINEATNGSLLDQNLLELIPSISTNINNMFSLRGPIENFVEDDIYVSINEMSAVLLSTIGNFNREHLEYITLYSELENKILSDAQFLNSILSVMLIIIAALILPISLTITRSINRLQRGFRKVGRGDLTGKAPKLILMKNELESVETSFYSLLGYLRDTLTVVKESGEYVAGISEELAAGTIEASDSINRVSNTIASISTGARQQNRMLKIIEERLNELQENINNATYQISAASNLLSKLAQRTNILGLNASINAAKSGKFGEGFGLVADEIRQLSQTSRDSANRISDLINDINFSIRDIVTTIVNDVSEIREVAEDTAIGSEESNTATSEQVIMISEISETSNQLADLATSLNELLQQFRIE